MRSSITGRKWRIRPWIGQAAASPSAQIVWPSTWRVTCSSVSISSGSARPSHHAVHHPHHPAGALAARRALAAAFVLVELATAARSRLMMSVDLSITMTAAVPRPVFTSRRLSKSISTVSQIDLGHQRHRRAAGDDRQQIVPAAAHAAGIASRSARAAECRALPRRCTACSRGRRCRTASCPEFFGRPSAANQAAPRRRMVGATAMLSTLLTVVGQPYRPTAAGNGGFSRGMPFLPSRLSSSAVSSPQI